MAPSTDLLDRLVQALKENRGTDVQLLEGERPRLRIRGDLRPVTMRDHPAVTRRDIEEIMAAALTPEQRRSFDETSDIDFSVELEGASGRVNVGYANGRRLHLSLRYLPAQIIPLEQLGIDLPMITRLAECDDGMVIVAGETSSGKTTTIMAMLDYINRTRHGAITTIENPVEYVLRSDKCLVTRREIGRDTPDFKTALRASVRKNPDVLLIGEIRDYETATIALSAAETGIQTFATIHSTGVLAAITRLANITIGFGHSEEEFYLRMSIALRGVIAQQLIKTLDGKGLMPLYEIMAVGYSEQNYLRDRDFKRLEQSLESERNISLGRCVYNLWRATPPTIDENTVRLVYGDQFNMIMSMLKGREGYRPLVSTVV